MSGDAPENWLQGLVVATGERSLTICVGATQHNLIAAADARVTLDGELCELRDLVGQRARISVEAKLPVIRLHDLRHTAATLLIADGESAKVVSERLGHAKVQTTLDIYTHVTPTMQKSAADKMDRLMA